MAVDIALALLLNNPPSPIPDPIAKVPQVMDYAGILLLIMVGFAVLTYFASQFFKKQDWEVFAKAELNQIFSSVLLLIFIVGAITFSQTIASGAMVYFMGEPPSPYLPSATSFDIAKNYVSSMINNLGLPILIRIKSIGIVAQGMSNLYLKGGCSAWGYNVLMMPLSMIDSNSDMLMFILLPVVSSLIVQLALLQMIESLYVYVLAAGLVLRILPPTRNAGTFLLMSALAFYVIYPLTYAMHYMAVQSMFPGMDRPFEPAPGGHYGYGIGTTAEPNLFVPPSGWTPPPGATEITLTDPWTAHFIGLKTRRVDDFMILFADKTVNAINGIGTTLGITYFLDDYFRMFNLHSLLILQGLLLPALTFIITSGFIKSMIKLST